MITATYLQTTYVVPTTTSTTFAAQNLGTPSAGREIIAFVMCNNSNATVAATSVVIGGVEATRVTFTTGNNHKGAIFRAHVPLGTTADVVVSGGAAVAVAMNLALWSVTDWVGASAGLSANNTTTLTITGATDGVILAAGWHPAGAAGGFAWTGATEAFDSSSGTPVSLASSTTVGSTTVSYTHTGSGEHEIMAVALAPGFAPSAIPAGYPAEIIADSPAAWWRFQETSGVAVHDSSGNGYEGTYTGSPTLGVTGPIDKAIHINGTSQYVAGTANLDLNTDATWTVEFWYKSATDTGGTMSVISQMTTNGSVGWEFWLAGNTTATVWRVTSNSSSATTTYLGDQWHHWVATWNGSTGKIYRDGVELTVTPTTTSGATGLSPLYVGRRQVSSPSNPTVGDIAEVAVYHSVLPTARILAHFEAGSAAAPGDCLAVRYALGSTSVSLAMGSNSILLWKGSGAPVTCPDTPTDEFVPYSELVLADGPGMYWRLGEASGLTAADASGNGRTGTINSSGIAYGIPSLVADEANTAMQFYAGGTGGFVQRMWESWMDSTTFTAEAVVRQDGNLAGYSAILGSDGTSRFWTLHLFDRLLTLSYPGGAGTILQDTEMLAVGTRYHVAVTVGGGVATLYKNGQVIDTAALTMTAPGSSGRSMQAGASPDGGGSGVHFQTFNGILDEVAWYPTALSGTQILAHATAGGFATGLTGMFTYHSAAGSTSGNTVTYSGVDLGPAAADREIIVTVGGDSTAASAPVVVIGGITATLVVENTPTAYNCIYRAWVPTGATGTITVTYASAPLANAITVYRITGGISRVNSTSGSQNTTSVSQTVATYPGGFVVAQAIMQTGSSPTTWTNAIERSDGTSGALDHSSAGVETTAEGSLVVTTGNGVVKTRYMAAASFGP